MNIDVIEKAPVATMTDAGLITLARVIEDAQRRLGVVAAKVQSEQLMRRDLNALEVQR
jgi:hypothetical protein